MKYFVFNKTSDYERGFGEHVTYHSTGLTVEEGWFKKASFWSRILDSFSDGMAWHRLTLNAVGTAMVKISFYTADTLTLQEGGRIRDLKEVLRSTQLSLSEKKEICRPYLKKELGLEHDILLHSLKGRYMWFLLEIYPQGEERIGLGDFMVSFPAESWSANLPELYRRDMGSDSFLDRFLAIFQSIYDDISWQIKDFIYCLDPQTADLKMLHWMASWLDVEEPYMWTEEQLRELLLNAMKLFAARGTVKGMELFVKLYTGELPFVVEWQDGEGFADAPNGLFISLYGEDPYSITVLVREECIPDHKDHQALLRLLDQIRPVQMKIRLVVLEPYIFADGYSYLGVNSVLGQYEGAVLNKNGRSDFATVWPAMANQERKPDDHPYCNE